MKETLVVTYKLEGTVDKIEEARARIASLQVCEEIVSMSIRYVRKA